MGRTRGWRGWEGWGWSWCGGGILLALALAGEAAAAGGGANPSAPGESAGIGLGLAMAAAAPLVIAVAWWRRWHRLAGRPRLAPAFSPPVGLVLFAFMFLAGMLGGEIVRRIFYGDLSPEQLMTLPLAGRARISMGHAAGQAVVAAVYAALAGRAGSAGRGATGRAALLGGGAFLLVWPLVSAASLVSGLVAERVSGEPVERIAHDTLQQLVDSPGNGWFLVMAGLVVLVVPVLEEVMYRGLLQRTLDGVGLGRWTAILLASLIFALMHVDAVPWHALPVLVVLSIGFGWAYERTRSLAAPIVMHIVFNAVNLGLAWLTTPGPDVSLLQ